MGPPTACLLIVSATAIGDMLPAACGVALSRQHMRTQIAALVLVTTLCLEQHGEHGDSKPALCLKIHLHQLPVENAVLRLSFRSFEIPSLDNQ